MPFFNRRKNNFKTRGGEQTEPFQRQFNRPGGIRKPFKAFSQRPMSATNTRGRGRPGRGRGGAPRRNRENNQGGNTQKRGNKNPINLDKEMDNYWGDKNKESRERILNDDMDSYWEKKGNKNIENEANVTEKTVLPVQIPVVVPEHHIVNIPKKKAVADVPL